MSTIGLCKDTKVARLVLREGGVERLNQFPNVWSRSFSRRDRIRTVGETYANWLVDVQHIGIVVEAEGVVHRCGIGSTVREVTWTILLKQTYHRAAAGTSIEPRSERCCGGILSCFEKPSEFSNFTARINEQLTRTTCSCLYRR